MSLRIVSAITGTFAHGSINRNCFNMMAVHNVMRKRCCDWISMGTRWSANVCVLLAYRNQQLTYKYAFRDTRYGQYIFKSGFNDVCFVVLFLFCHFWIRVSFCLSTHTVRRTCTQNQHALSNSWKVVGL